MEDTRGDIVLIEGIVARDERAVADLYDRHCRLLFGLIMRILRDRREAEEVLQEVFVLVWTRAETYNVALGPPAAWLVRIARNRAIDRLRANNVRHRQNADPNRHARASRAVVAGIYRAMTEDADIVEFDQIVALALAGAPGGAEPRPEVKQQLMQKAAASSDPAGFAFHHASDDRWLPHPVPGIRMKVLALS